MKKPTIKDVAKLAGVSPSTVSRVLSNNKMISDKTSERVRQAIEELNYTINYSARSLAVSDSQTVAVVLDRGPGLSLNNSFFVEILQAIALELVQYNKELLLIFSSSDEDERKRVENLTKSNRVDGLIKLSIRNDDSTIKYLTENKYPAVIIGTPEKGVDISYVDNDNVKAMYEVCSYLINQGKSRLAFVGGSEQYIVTRNRRSGYEKALTDNNLYFGKEDQYYVEFSKEDAYNRAGEILEKDYDAIVCTDDLIALGIIERANELKDKVVVTGFNNSLEAKLSNNKIATVDINAPLLGKKAVDLLMSRIEEDSEPKGILVETEFIVR